MITIRKTWMLAVAVSMFSTILSAQASRTWVSGVGDDANPGSRTAPCKTFAGAISKTAAGGEINVLDPGGFGAVTITKAITIDGTDTEAGVLVSGTNGIVVNAGTNDVVVLRNLDFNGLGTGLDGISFLGGKALIIDNCRIYGFTNGIHCSNSTQANLVISNSQIYNCSGTGLALYGPINSSVTHSSFNQMGANGIVVESTSLLTMSNCTIANNTSTGLFCYGASVQIQADSCDIAQNLYGITSQAGTVRISNCTVTGNHSAYRLTGGTVFTYGDNRVTGNTYNETASGVIGLK